MDWLTIISSSGWESKVFPKDLCVLHQRDSKVLDAEERFVCLIDNREWETAELRILSPYTYEDDEGILFDWTDGNNVFSHFENSVHEDDSVVVAWRLLEDD